MERSQDRLKGGYVAEGPAIPFTPPHVSVNRVAIVDLPGLPLDEEVRGRRAYNLLSPEAILAYAQEHAPALNLDPAQPFDVARRRVPLLVDGALSSAREERRGAAEVIARRLGRNLAYILLTLHRGDRINREARPDWEDTDWERWRSIRRVWFGGGVMSGELGRRVIGEARAHLENLGCDGVLEIDVTPYRGDLALYGAARYLSAAQPDAVVCDFGHTAVKRAHLGLVDGTITQVRSLDPIPAPWEMHNEPRAAAEIDPQEVLDFVGEVVARTLQESGAAGTDLVLSVAAYVEGGRLLGNGIYARMSRLTIDVRPLVEGAVAARTGRGVRVRFIHDGTAAAALHAGEVQAAVIVVGTALGVGFPPAEAEDLRPLASDLVLITDVEGSGTGD